MLSSPLTFAGNKENGNIESIILIGCVPWTMILVYTLVTARKKRKETSFHIGLGDVPPPILPITENIEFVFEADLQSIFELVRHSWINNKSANTSDI